MLAAALAAMLLIIPQLSACRREAGSRASAKPAAAGSGPGAQGGAAQNAAVQQAESAPAAGNGPVSMGPARPSAAPPPNEAPPEPGEPPAPAGRPFQGGQQPPQAGAAAATKRRIDYRPLPVPLANSRSLSPAAPSAGIGPSDFIIGPLAPETDPSLENQAALLTAKNFLASICSGSFPDKLVLPSTRPLLSLVISPLLKEEKRPSHFRIGRLLAASDPGSGDTVASARIRLDEKSGEINLRKENKSWYVESISLDERDAAGSGEKPAEDLYEPRLGAE